MEDGIIIQTLQEEIDFIKQDIMREIEMLKPALIRELREKAGKIFSEIIYVKTKKLDVDRVSLVKQGLYDMLGKFEKELDEKLINSNLVVGIFDGGRTVSYHRAEDTIIDICEEYIEETKIVFEKNGYCFNPDYDRRLSDRIRMICMSFDASYHFIHENTCNINSIKEELRKADDSKLP